MTEHEDTAGRRALLALIDGAMPLVGMWLWWQLQDDTSRLRLALADVRERAGQAWRQAQDRRRARLVDDLIASATDTEGAS